MHEVFNLIYNLILLGYFYFEWNILLYLGDTDQAANDLSVSMQHLLCIYYTSELVGCFAFFQLVYICMDPRWVGWDLYPIPRSMLYLSSWRHVIYLNSVRLLNIYIEYPIYYVLFVIIFYTHVMITWHDTKVI